MTRPIFAEDVLRKVRAVGQYYGFIPFETLAAQTRGPVRKDREPLPALPQGDPTAETVASFLKQCRDAGIVPEVRAPLFVFHTNIAPGRVAPRTAVIQFHGIGTDRTLADAVLIRAFRALVADLYRAEPEVRVNSMGDKETRARFARELGSFFKKRGDELPSECVECAKRDVVEAAGLAIERDCADDLPAPVDHLSDQSRRRFEDLLEYLEDTETPYTLAPTLLSRGLFWSEACFEIRLPGEVGDHRVVAWGSRYPELVRLLFKIPFAAGGAVLRIGNLASAKVPAVKSGRIRIAFVHIGEEAKRESIKIAEALKRAHLPLLQLIGIESLAEQMRIVERVNPPYLLIMGRKEALEHSAVLRNRLTQEETPILLSELTKRLKSFV